MAEAAVVLGDGRIMLGHNQLEPAKTVGRRQPVRDRGPQRLGQAARSGIGDARSLEQHRRVTVEVRLLQRRGGLPHELLRQADVDEVVGPVLERCAREECVNDEGAAMQPLLRLAEAHAAQRARRHEAAADAHRVQGGRRIVAKRALVLHMRHVRLVHEDTQDGERRRAGKRRGHMRSDTALATRSHVVLSPANSSSSSRLRSW